jgi:hypothetical protein
MPDVADGRDGATVGVAADVRSVRLREWAAKGR